MDRRYARTAALLGVALAAAAVTVPAVADDDAAASPYVRFVARDLRLSPAQAAERVRAEEQLVAVRGKVSDEFGVADTPAPGLGDGVGDGDGGADSADDGRDGRQRGNGRGAAGRGGLGADLQEIIGLVGRAVNSREAGELDSATVADLVERLGSRRAGGGADRGQAAVFSGTWVDKRTRTLRVGVTDPAAAEAVRRAGAEPTLTRYNAAQLAAVKADLDSRARDIASTSASGWFVDPADNRVVVLAAPGHEERATRWAYRSGAPRDSIRVRRSAERPRPLVDVRGADAFLVENVSRCSVGFAIQGGFLTAGHCGTAGQITSAGEDGDFQGAIFQSSFPGDDFGVVATASAFIPTPAVATELGEIPVTGSLTMPPGATVCRSGSTTGTRCGLIEALDATVNYAEGPVGGLTRTNVCAEAGDSGGPFFSGTQAQGLTSGGSGDCVTGGVTFFQPVNEPLALLGLSLLTAAEPTPPVTAATLAAAAGPRVQAAAGDDVTDGGACAAASRTFRGALAAGGEATLPYQAGAGTQTVCLGGPAGTNFDVALQRWTGTSWRTVAAGAGVTSAETVTYTGSAGRYQLKVLARTGTGTYTAAVG